MTKKTKSQQPAVVVPPVQKPVALPQPIQPFTLTPMRTFHTTRTQQLTMAELLNNRPRVFTTELYGTRSVEEIQAELNAKLPKEYCPVSANNAPLADPTDDANPVDEGDSSPEKDVVSSSSSCENVPPAPLPEVAKTPEVMPPAAPVEVTTRVVKLTAKNFRTYDEPIDTTVRSWTWTPHEDHAEIITELVTETHRDVGLFVSWLMHAPKAIDGAAAAEIYQQLVDLYRRQVAAHGNADLISLLEFAATYKVCGRELVDLVYATNDPRKAMYLSTWRGPIFVCGKFGIKSAATIPTFVHQPSGNNRVLLAYRFVKKDNSYYVLRAKDTQTYALPATELEKALAGGGICIYPKK